MDRRFIPLRVLAVTLCLAFGEAPSFAQVRSEDPRTTSRLHLGPVYLTPTAALSEFGFDTNVFNDAGEREKDFTFTITPRLVSAVPFARRGLLRLSTGADFVYYQKYDSERSVNPQVVLRGELYFNRLTLFAEPSYLRTRQRPSFEIDLRSRRVEQGTVAGTELRIYPKLSAEIFTQHRRIVFDADQFFLGTSLSETLNHISWTHGAAIRWATTPLTTLIVRVESTNDRFLISQIRDSDSMRAVAGVELKPRALISGSAEVGLRRFATIDASVPDFTGLVASAGLSYTLSGSTTFRFTASRGTGYSFEPLEPYYVATEYGLTARRQLFGSFDAMAGLALYRYVYRDLVSGTSDLDHIRSGRVDITNWYSGSIGYRIGQTGRIGIGVSYWTRNSDRRDFRDYDGLRIGTSLTYGL